MKHTQGKWEIEYDNTGNGYYSEWYSIFTNEKHIARVGDCKKMIDEDKANAHLIASAPELLEACKHLLKGVIPINKSGISNICEYLGKFEVYGHTLERIKQAISLAEGKE